jgi:hypothetical protein
VPTGYDPELYFYHKIPAVKATLHFVLKQAFIKGYDRVVITGKPRNTLLDLFLVYAYVMIFGMKNFISLLVFPSYHPFTWVIDTIKKPTSYIGGVKATFDLKQNKDIWD